MDFISPRLVGAVGARINVGSSYSYNVGLEFEPR